MLKEEKTAIAPFAKKIKSIVTKPVESKKEIIGFLPSWSVAEEKKVYPEYLSQIIYFGLGVTENGDLITQDEKGEPVLEWTYFLSDYFKKVREEAAKSNTKVLLAVKCFDNATIDNLISNQVATDNLIRQLINLINKYHLNGVNIDFEYVTDIDFPTSTYFVSFLEKLSQEMKKDLPGAVISVDVNALAVVKDKAYNMTKISKIVDQVILMAYDYRQQNSTKSGPTAPISGGSNEHSITESLDALSDRVPNEKLILAIPFMAISGRHGT